MKKVYLKIAVCALGLSLSACGGGEKEEKKEETVVVDKEKEEAESKKREEHGYHNYDKQFQLVTTSYDGIFRGVDMYATKQEVKEAEETAKMYSFEGSEGAIPMATLVEETDEMLTYNLQMDEKDDAVIQYMFNDEGKLNAIKLVVHVKDLVEYEAMEQDFMTYFTHKHGSPTMFDDKKEVWKVKGSDIHEIDIIDRRENDKFYLEVDVS